MTIIRATIAVVPRDGGWTISLDGNHQIFPVFPTKDEAEQVMKTLLRSWAPPEPMPDEAKAVNRLRIEVALHKAAAKALAAERDALRIERDRAQKALDLARPVLVVFSAVHPYSQCLDAARATAFAELKARAAIKQPQETDRD